MAQANADDDELLDLVDDNDQVIGQIRRGDMKTLTLDGGKYVRSSDLFIVRSDGQIWVPVRNKHKAIAPGGLDFSVGGHVLSGDTYEQTMVRELEEEAGIKVNPEDLVLIASMGAARTHISHLYMLRTDTQPTLSEEHVSGQWMSIDDLQKSLEAGVAAKVSMLEKLLLLKEYLKSHPVSV